MGYYRNALGDLCFSDPVDVGLQQRAGNLLALVLRQNSQGMDCNRATIFVMADGLSVLHSHALGLPVFGKLHSLVGHKLSRNASRNDVSN